MKKTKRTISVDPIVWEYLQAKARHRQRSTSWLAEEAFRKYLRLPKGKTKEVTSCSACG